jgi:hypothetical protein
MTAYSFGACNFCSTSRSYTRSPCRPSTRPTAPCAPAASPASPGTRSCSRSPCRPSTRPTAIGRCATTNSTCLSGLMHLLAESMVVIKKLLQTKESEHQDEGEGDEGESDARPGATWVPRRPAPGGSPVPRRTADALRPGVYIVQYSTVCVICRLSIGRWSCKLRTLH